MLTSLEDPVPGGSPAAAPPFVVIPLALFSLESNESIIKIFAAGTAVPVCSSKLVGILGGIGPEEVKGLYI